MLNLNFEYLLCDKKKEELKEISIPDGSDFFKMVLYLRDMYANYRQFRKSLKQNHPHIESLFMKKTAYYTVADWLIGSGTDDREEAAHQFYSSWFSETYSKVISLQIDKKIAENKVDIDDDFSLILHLK